jgi:hypothetical protein
MLGKYSGWNTKIPTALGVVEESPYEKLTLGGGRKVSVTKTFSQGTEPIHTNLFSFVGAFRLLKVYGRCSRVGVGGSADIDDCWFNVYDGTNTVALSLGGGANGQNISNITVGSLIFVDNKVSAVFSYQKSDEVRSKNALYEGSDIWQETIVSPKNGLTNYFRFSYDTAVDSGIDLDIRFSIFYEDIDNADPSEIVAV